MSPTVLEPAAERLFPHFLDPVDGTACLPASSTPAEIAASCSPAGLRFPLLLDPSVVDPLLIARARTLKSGNQT